MITEQIFLDLRQGYTVDEQVYASLWHRKVESSSIRDIGQIKNVRYRAQVSQPAAILSSGNDKEKIFSTHG